ncbi:hypothetical protein MRB53_015352 [Persea americana]|uniref:Uncharacterized protein n=1 Tax=Persea americana TaxID=3435 RepID=A0ACC2KDI6_PERAE|nr:hypothetical protein MRB53_015352 [Persea americana]
MGCSSSKIEKSEPLRLCRERKRFIKQAIDSRYALAAAHLSYVQSLHNVGIALRRFAEAQVLIESSLSTSATEVDKTPSHSSYPSPSPSHNAELADSPLNNESPLSPRLSTVSFMKSGGSAAVTVQISPSFNRFDEDDSLTFPLPPPPPPEPGSSWDFFDPLASTENFMFHGENSYSRNFGNLMDLRRLREELGGSSVKDEEEGKSGLNEKEEFLIGSISPGVGRRSVESTGDAAVDNKSSRSLIVANSYSFNGVSNTDAEQTQIGKEKMLKSDLMTKGSAETSARNASSERSGSKKEKLGSEKEMCAEREDPSEFITHRAKDFLSSVKDIEHRFFRASESGREVSRMLEANKIQISCSETKGRSSASIFLATYHLVCCSGEALPAPQEPSQHVKKVITWNRSMSSHSSSSKNPLASGTRDDDSGSDFVEEFCMISGRHSSTLERLYAWERKLYDEVKATEIIGKEYDQKCNLLRHQFAQDLKTQVIDKTRATVKDLYSRLKVAIHAVNSISMRIEKLRDEELQPQLFELIQGLIRMWKAMLECHHAQYITISLAYHAKSSTAASQSESHKQVVIHLEHEIEYFGSSFADWISAHQSYVEALNGWLQNCILQSQERSSRRRWTAPRQAMGPPILILFRDWSAGIKTLPSVDLSDSIKSFVSDLHRSFGQRVEEQQKQQDSDNLDGNQGPESKEDEKCEKVCNLSSLQASLTRMFDRLTKFSEASLKMYEEIRQVIDSARADHTSGRMRL